MHTKIQKWGNSLALRIPHAFVKQAELNRGALVNVDWHSNALIITPVRKNYGLKELLAGINASNRHNEADFRVKKGKEVW